MTHDGYLLFAMLLIAAGISLFQKHRHINKLNKALNRKELAIHGFYNDPEKMNELRRHWIRLEGCEEDRKLSRLAESIGTDVRWYKHAWPLRQISLDVGATPGTLTTAVPDMLRRIPVSQLCSPGEELRRFFSDHNMTLRIMARTFTDKPSYFGSAGCGGHVEPNVWTEVFGEQTDKPDRENVRVLLQLTRHGGEGETGWFLEQTASRIEQGQLAAGDHDDDCGYAFRVYPCKAVQASIRSPES